MVVQVGLVRPDVEKARASQEMYAGEKCFVFFGAPKSDGWEPVGERDLTRIQFLEVIASHFEFASWINVSAFCSQTLQSVQPLQLSPLTSSANARSSSKRISLPSILVTFSHFGKSIK